MRASGTRIGTSIALTASPSAAHCSPPREPASASWRNSSSKTPEMSAKKALTLPSGPVFAMVCVFGPSSLLVRPLASCITSVSPAGKVTRSPAMTTVPIRTGTVSPRGARVNEKCSDDGRYSATTPTPDSSSAATTDTGDPSSSIAAACVASAAPVPAIHPLNIIQPSPGWPPRLRRGTQQSLLVLHAGCPQCTPKATPVGRKGFPLREQVLYQIQRSL